MTNLSPGGLLTLDLSSMVGWCYGPVTEKLPLACDTWELPKFGGRGAKGMAFQNELVVFLRKVRPKNIVMESALPLPAMNNREAAFQAFGLAYLVYTEAYRESVTVSEIDVWTARREVFGVTLRSMNPKYLKKEILRLIRGKNIPARDHHQADAAALWLWNRQRVSHGAGPLWEDNAA
jgi:hypothetical protein